MKYLLAANDLRFFNSNVTNQTKLYLTEQMLLIFYNISNIFHSIVIKQSPEIFIDLSVVKHKSLHLFQIMTNYYI